MRERGSASVLAVGGIAVLGMFLGVATQLGGAVMATHRARAAADLAALAGAAAGEQGDTRAGACSRAAAVAAANGANVVSCAVGEDGSVTVTTHVTPPRGLAALARGPARGVARAGPVPDQPPV